MRELLAAALVVAVSGCTLSPLSIAPPGRPTALPSADLALARIVIRVPRSRDDRGGLGVVRSYALLRERVDGEDGPVPFAYRDAPDASTPEEAVFYDTSAVPGQDYRYQAFALAAQERMTFGSPGALAAGSALSDAVTAPGSATGEGRVRPPTRADVAESEKGTGLSVVLTFGLSPDDEGAVRYAALRATPDGPFLPFPGGIDAPEEVDEQTRRKTIDVPAPGQYRFRVYAVPERGEATGRPTGTVTTRPSFFDPSRLPIGIVLLMTGGLMIVFLWWARRSGHAVFIRRIPGVDAIEEAVGRATEMGQPVLYVPGIDEIQNIQTIASMLILGRVAEMVARYDTELLVPCRIPLVATVSEEVVQQGFYDAGRPDAHRPRNIQWISSEQFAYCAGTAGIILRQKPATNLYLGRFFAESLLLGETGYVNRAIQVAGTAAIPQLPFFIASCDYTLIGEELFAVSAYMTREPKLLSSLKAADWVKALCIAVLLVGAVTAVVAPGSSMVQALVQFLSP